MEHTTVRFEDGAGRQLLAVQSRTGVIVTVATATWSRLNRIELDDEQVEALRRFLEVTDGARSSTEPAHPASHRSG